ncbi:hypothetical protein BO85DRAFT_107087 [Aspergillus piperis CBS 112811]|uniref:Uncharacterized protein n=1 Tax=Aspergillus piperis CBS 112811 TaxID=1448313 RepID=A0A8G1RAL8_9EURO|nr:hypothetical protein BO85DRAFT_107087 [Aspergillus piperis CBS 112811]RAH61527.1 hypothetical protein BO85DRAFT_107087 [Aspergillus piperis CBS 112811]
MDGFVLYLFFFFFSSGVTFGDFRLCYYYHYPYLYFTVLCVVLFLHFRGYLHYVCLSIHRSAYIRTLMYERIDVIWMTILRGFSLFYFFIFMYHMTDYLWPTHTGCVCTLF